MVKGSKGKRSRSRGRRERKRERRTRRRMPRGVRARINRVQRSIRRATRYQRSGRKKPGRAITFRQGRVKRTAYGKDAKGRSLRDKGIHPNQKAEKVVKGARFQKRPSASYYYNVLNKPVGTKIYYRPKKSGKEVLHVLQLRSTGIPYWKVQK